MTEGHADDLLADRSTSRSADKPGGPVLILQTRKGDRVLRLSSRTQLLFAGVAVVALGWMAYSSLALFLTSHAGSAKDLEIASSHRSNEVLQDALAEVEERLRLMTGDLEAARDQASLLLTQHDGLAEERDRLAEERDSLALQQATLASRAEEMDGALADALQRQGNLEQQLQALEGQLAEAATRADETAGQRDRFASEVADLQALIDSMRDQQREIVDRVSGRTVASIGDLEGLVQNTGLDVALLVDRAEEVQGGLAPGGQGGPFIPADTLLATDAAYELQVSVAMLDNKLDRWDALQRIAAVLPLAAPLEHYEITSDFGYRKDPINGLLALHSGVDFAAPRKTSVLATGPGIVTFAGWRGQYGRVVEIDHGFGIKTRYAHLAKISVKKGQEMQLGEEVGLLGTSGRVTGPHVHYEVLFDEKPFDPMKFLTAAKHD